MRSDVCLILEGTYPYIAGGVSTWVAQILQAMPQLRFSILFIGADRKMKRELKYEVPPNVVEIQEVFLHDYGKPTLSSPESCIDNAGWAVLEQYFVNTYRGETPDLVRVAEVVRAFPSRYDLIEVLTRSREGWHRIRSMYNRLMPAGTSFIDFFWTHRFINVPALGLLMNPLPRARVYHTACTGYAGLLGSFAAATTGSPLILTEHGIYARERRIEIFNADWIHRSNVKAFLDMQRGASVFKHWWINFFLSLSHSTYEAAAEIVTLFEMNRWIQIRDGADHKKTKIIPNGIDLARFGELKRRERRVDEPFQIGFVGRITAIKDIKTLIRAMGSLKNRGVPFQTHLLGPLDEEPDYVDECRAKVKALDLENEIYFVGRVNVMDYLPKLDVIILTSISEGQPFVILEGNCAGVPVVSTDVGSCSELLNGRTPADRSLGPSGLITPVGSPAVIADALETLARDPALCKRMGENGYRRVRAYYDIREVMSQYLELYEMHLYAGAAV